MPEDSTPSPESPFELTDETHKFTVSSHLEICQILNSIMRQATMVTATLGADDFFLTSIVGVDEDNGQFMVECGKQSDQISRAVELQKMAVTTSLEKIKIQFECTDIEHAEYDGRDVLVSAIPQQLLRLQRREYYRMPVPMSPGVKCTLTPAGSTTAVSLALADISCGGMGLKTPAETFTPQLGETYNCMLHLPGGGPLKVDVQARNSSSLRLANGKLTQKLGFMFVDLPQSAFTLVQRYIMNLQRQSAARG